MKVKDLKKLLNNYDDEMEVLKKDGNYELRDSWTKLEENNLLEFNVDKKVKEFRDDFDGICYGCEVYEINHKNEGKNVLVIL